MVVGEGYDSSLWLLLAGDEVHRDRVINFIAKMPKDVLEKIQEIIKEEPYKSKVYVESTKEYHFALRMINGILNISLGKCLDNGLIGDTFVLSLIPTNKDTLLKRKFYAKKQIGWFLDSKNEVINDPIRENLYSVKNHIIEMDYKLIYTPFGTIFESCYKDGKSVGSSKYHSINLRNMPDKMFIHQFEDERKINRLVRRKVKK